MSANSDCVAIGYAWFGGFATEGRNKPKMSYTKLLYHIVFRTKSGEWAITEAHEEKLYRYIWGYVKEKQCILYRINGMPDHIHLFVGLHSTVSVADFVKEMKNATHLFLEQNKALFPNFYAWSKGYCALTYSEKDKDKIINYIKNQKEHHKKQQFTDEMKSLFADYGIEYHEQFFERNI